MSRRHKRVTVFFLSLMLIVMSCGIVLPAMAKERTTKTVRVGYILSAGYQEGGDGEYKTGQGYEYLQKIAAYAAWNYEYVYGDFSELLAMLENGEIDLMGNLSYTEERAENIYYGIYEQGKESFYLYVKGSESGIRSADHSSINGKRIGVSTNSYQKTIWEAWCKEQGIQCEIIDFASLEERTNALNDGTIDGTIGSFMLSNTTETKNWRSVLKFGDAPYYFGVSMNRPDLWLDLNNAQEKILDEDPYYNEELSTKYIQSGVLSRNQLKEDELSWLKENGGLIRVGCLDNYLPLSNRDEEGNMKGVIPDLLTAMEIAYEEYHVQFEPVVYSDYQQMLQDLKKGNIDLAVPVLADYWIADQEGISLTNSFMSTTMLLINESSNSMVSIQKIGIDRQSPVQKVYADIYYPGYEQVLYPSMTDVAAALAKGNVDVGLSTACCYHVQAKLDSNMKNMNRVTLPSKVNLAMAVSRDNPELITIMNRGISMVGETEIFNSLAINSNVDTHTTLTDYVSENPVTALLISAGTIAILLAIIIRLKWAVQRAKTDPMTGLLNKAAMHEQIKENMDRGGILFMIDIDNFKAVNDVLGHNTGDIVIMDFAENLKKIFRTGDIIGRFGGDEFMVFLPGAVCQEEIVKRKVMQMEQALKNCSVFEAEERVACSVSAGVLVIKPDKNQRYAVAFEQADVALYEAKKKGKNTYVVKEMS